MELKDRIKQLRMEKGFTTSQMAVQFGKSEGAVRMWETGRSNPDVQTLLQMCEMFNCTSDFLLGKSDIRNESSKEQTDERIDRLLKLLAPYSEEQQANVLDSVIDYVENITDTPHDQLGTLIWVVTSLANMLHYGKAMLENTPDRGPTFREYIFEYSLCMDTISELKARHFDAAGYNLSALKQMRSGGDDANATQGDA